MIVAKFIAFVPQFAFNQHFLASLLFMLLIKLSPDERVFYLLLKLLLAEYKRN
jgi:hypothetical protein